MRVIGFGNLRRFVAPAVLVVAGVSVLAAGKPTTWTPVTATFRCADGDGDVGCPALDRIRSDGSAYTGHPASTEGAFLNQFGGFTIRLFSNTPDRSIWLGLWNRKAGTDGPCGYTPNSTVFTTEAELRINALDNDGNTIGLNGVPTSESRDGFGILNYSDGEANVIWTIRWNPGDVIVTRTATDAWTIQSSTDAEALLQCTVKKGRTPGGDEAVYTLPFHIPDTKP